MRFGRYYLKSKSAAVVVKGLYNAFAICYNNIITVLKETAVFIYA